MDYVDDRRNNELDGDIRQLITGSSRRGNSLHAIKCLLITYSGPCPNAV